MGIPTFAALINNKVIMPCEEPRYYNVDQHFLRDCMSDLLGRVQVDEHWYLSAYPDVGKALADGVVPDCRTHFMRFGYYEHRMPYRIEVDEQWYLKIYPDIQKAIERRSFKSGQDHFDQFGYREGRLPFANFSLVQP
jgi:hypothetical protein